MTVYKRQPPSPEQLEAAEAAKMFEAANFGVAYIEACPECKLDHSVPLMEKCFQNELHMGYFVVCPWKNKVTFVSINEIGEQDG